MLKDNEFEAAAKSFQAKHSKIARITNKTEKPWCWLVLRHYSSSFVGRCHWLLMLRMGFLVVFLSLQRVVLIVLYWVA
jgi:hypothetical protein